ncbi:MAG TPA: inosine/xanthosine triphosphatase [Aggregatilineales bacterium]|nr:inosine/xanthosine triphosphatase [Aggregatilineales bacterium]
MTRIVVASTNRVKVDAALNGFRAMFPGQTFDAEGINVESGVSAQPVTDLETLQGATNRARAIQQRRPDADYWVGIEGGVEEIAGEMEVFAWVVVIGTDNRRTRSRTATFYLPHEVVTLIRQGVELGDADDRVFGRSNSKQQNGSVGILTQDVITRLSYYEHAVILALIPFKNPALTFG